MNTIIMKDFKKIDKALWRTIGANVHKYMGQKRFVEAKEFDDLTMQDIFDMFGEEFILKKFKNIGEVRFAEMKRYCA